jgi:intracellular septation protein
MKLLIELLPILAFFIAYKLFDLYTATGVAIGITIVQILWMLCRRKPVSKMQLFNGVIITVFGGLTLILHNKEFIMIKPTVLYWSFAFGLAVSCFVFKRNVIQMVLGKEIRLNSPNPESIWAQVNCAWILYFIVLGALNLYVAKTYPENTWVNFKLSTIGMLIIFIILQGLWLSKYIQKDVTEEEN